MVVGGCRWFYVVVGGFRSFHILVTTCLGLSAFNVLPCDT